MEIAAWYMVRFKITIQAIVFCECAICSSIYSDPRPFACPWYLFIWPPWRCWAVEHVHPFLWPGSENIRRASSARQDRAKLPQDCPDHVTSWQSLEEPSLSLLLPWRQTCILYTFHSLNPKNLLRFSFLMFSHFGIMRHGRQFARRVIKS